MPRRHRQLQTKWTRYAAGLWPAFVLLGACSTAEPGPLTPTSSTACPVSSSDVRVGGAKGSGVDRIVTPNRTVVLMGGGAEHDSAASAFVGAANGGDITILRASGSISSYPLYFGSTLAPDLPPASVVTVLTPTPEAAADSAALCWVDRAEAVWLAGGNQWDYLGRWPEPFHAQLAARAQAGAAMGGTSAGAMALGEMAFDARFGTVSSVEALADPTQQAVSVSASAFFPAELEGVVVDSHFSDRDREGRLLAFVARTLEASGRTEVVGLGLDEGVAFTIQSGSYRVDAPQGQSAWVYAARGPWTLEGGQPLSLAGIERQQLSDGESGSWPVLLDPSLTQRLEVVQGVVVLR